MGAKNKIVALRNLAKHVELTVLVWGPGDPGASGSPQLKRYWAKRNQIREQLQREFPNSEVFFSEDTDLQVLTNAMGATMLDQELVHAYVADCILVLDLSRGAHVEVDRFTAYPIIAAKMNLLIPDQYIGTTGLVSHIHAKTNVTGFSEHEFDSCLLATEKAVRIVEMVAINKFIGH